MSKAAMLTQNQLLAVLPEQQLASWLPHLEPVELSLGEVLYEPGSHVTHVYFPTTAIVSLLYVMENGAAAEIAVVGNEGVVGISLFMGGDSTTSRAVVQSAGTGFRINARLLMLEFTRGGPVLHLLLRYTQALITQMGQTAVCNRHHSLDQQLCRWLLLSLDRLQSSNLVDPGIDRQHARRASRGRDRSSRQIAAGRTDQVPAWPHHRAGSGWAGAARLRVLRSRQA